MKLQYFSLAIILFFISCSEPNDKKDLAAEKILNSEKNKWQNLNKIADQYGAIAGMDTLYFSFSYRYQDYLSKNSKILLNDFNINDVIRNDSLYIISISSGYSPKFFFDIECDNNLFNKLRSSISIIEEIGYLNSDNIYLIVNIESIEKIKFKIESEAEIYFTDEEVEVNTDLTSSPNFRAKGKLLFIHKN
jgi:hypothetical protein